MQAFTITMRKKYNSTLLFVLSVVFIVLFLFFVYPHNTQALSGEWCFNKASAPITLCFASFDLCQSAVLLEDDALSGCYPEGTIDLLCQSAGGNQNCVTGATNTFSNFLNSVTGAVGSDPIDGFFNTVTQDVFNDLLGTSNVNDIADVLIAGGTAAIGEVFGDTLTQTGALNVDAILNEAGGDLFGQLLSAAQAAGVPSDVIRLINDVGGTIFGQTAHLTSATDIVDVVTQTTTSELFADLLNTDLVGPTGLPNPVTDLINRCGGVCVGDLLTAAGSAAPIAAVLATASATQLDNWITAVGGPEKAGDFFRLASPAKLQELADLLAAGDLDAAAALVEGILSPGVDICAGGDKLGGGSPAGTNPGSPASGSFVPVKDFEAEAYLKAIEKDITQIEIDTAKIEGDTRAIRFYLKQLCEKEYVRDQDLQHRWADVAAKFVHSTVIWINTAYNNNPVYVSNPYVYFRNVDRGVIEAFIAEIDKADINDSAKRILTASFQQKLVDVVFPDLINATLTEDDMEELDRDFTSGGGWRAWTDLTNNPANNIYKILSLAETELQQRRTLAQEIEKEKLRWGRGFFSWESCGQNVFTGNEKDIRTCRIHTPGSLIQDLSALVLGSAMRQIENADEYEEWIGQYAFESLNYTLGNIGLRFTALEGGSAPGAAPPETIEQRLEEIRNIPILGLQPGAKSKSDVGTFYGADSEERLPTGRLPGEGL